MMVDLGQYGFYIWGGFAAVALALLVLGVSSLMKYKKLSGQFDKLKDVQGNRRVRRDSPSKGTDKGLDNAS